MGEWLKNIGVSLQATGPAAAVSVWFISMACVAIWGGENSGLIAGFLGTGGMMVLLSLTQSHRG